MKHTQKLLSLALAIALFMSVIPFSFVSAAEETQPQITVTMGYIFETNVNIRKDATTSSDKVANVSKWHVSVLDSKKDTLSTQNPSTKKTYVWYKISYTSQSDTITGYVREDMINVTEYKLDSTFAESLKDFPTAYHNDLILLHAMYPKWKFTADKVENSLTQAVSLQDNEYTKLVETSYNSWRSMRNKCYDWATGKFITTDGGRYGASTEVIAYYMDPRNFLNANDIYIYMQQSYDGSTQTLEGVQSLLNGTFLSGNVTDKNDKYYGKPYAGVIRKAASVSGVNAYVLASTIIQEHGTKGTSLSKGYSYEYKEGKTKKVYNFFNFGASGTTSAEVLANGAEYAYNAGWFTPTESIVGNPNTGFIFETGVNIREDATTKSDKVAQASELTVKVLSSKNDTKNEQNPKTGKPYVWYKISYVSNSKTITGYVREDLIEFTEGGATKYGKNYIAIGQDTYFYKNYNVLSPDRTWHQYAQNVADSLSSSRGLKNTYSELHDLRLTFRIPVYTSLPSKVSSLPAKNDKYNNYYFENLSSEGLTPAYSRYKTKYTLTSKGDAELYYKLPEGATYAGETTYPLIEGENTVKLKIKSQTGFTKTYTITVTAEKAGSLTVKSSDGTLQKEDDGKWYYYVDGKKSNDTTLVKYSDKWFYIKDGVWTKDTTLFKYSGKWFYIKDGVWTKDTTLFKYSGKWFYIENGKWNSTTETLTKYNDVWFYIKNGKWDKTANTLFKYSDKWFYIEGGKWVKDTLIFNFKEKDFYIKSGKVDFDFVGKKTIDGVTYSIKNGKVVS